VPGAGRGAPTQKRPLTLTPGARERTTFPPTKQRPAKSATLWQVALARGCHPGRQRGFGGVENVTCQKVGGRGEKQGLLIKYSLAAQAGHKPKKDQEAGNLH